MAAFDGSIRIDSKIESKGFNTGIKSMIASVGKLAVAIAAAFAVRAITQFGKSAVDEASKMASALIGLQSVVEGTGNSFTGAQEFIRSFTADGLVPAADAITAYKNLLLRGYDTSQIESTLKALKDSAAFGRSAHLTLGEAVKTATEGLRNENSILVDNAGVTKNISIIWRDYAESIGTTVAALTKEQKIQAEVLGIMEETKFQTGDAAKLSGTYAGQVSALGVSFLNLKVAIGNVIIPIATKVIPYIRAAIDALVIFFNRLATLMSLFFGVDQSANATANSLGSVAENTDDAAAAQDGLAESTKKAGKAAKGALAAFDQLNVLQQPEDEAGTDDAPGIPTIPVAIEPEIQDPKLEAMKTKVEEFKQKLLEMLAPAISAFDRLKEALQPLGETIWQGLKWAWDNILLPLGEWAASELLPRVFDLLAVGVANLNIALEALAPLGEWLWEHFLKPLGQWTGEILLATLDWLIIKFGEIGQWVKQNEEAYRAFVAIVLIVGAALALWILGPIALIIAAIIGVIAIIANWGKIWEWLGQKGRDTLQFIKDDFKNLAVWFKTTVTEPIQNAFKKAFDSITAFVRADINLLIDFINGLVSSVVNAINTIISGFNTIGSLAPGFVPVSNITAPRIPKLATGAVIPPNAQFAAILGDQKSGKNIEAPESLIRQIMREEMQAVGGEMNITMPVYLDGEKIYQNQKRVNTRHGRSLVAGTK